MDIGAYDREGNAAVFTANKFRNSILEETFPFPQNMKVGNTNLPYFFRWLSFTHQKPYVQRKPQSINKGFSTTIG